MSGLGWLAWLVLGPAYLLCAVGIIALMCDRMASGRPGDGLPAPPPPDRPPETW